MPTSLPSAVSQFLHTASQPRFVFGRWRPPKFSRRKLADLQKQFYLHDLEFPSLHKPFQKRIGSPDLIRMKGHKRHRDVPARWAKIEENMAKMPQMIEEWRKNNRLEKHKQIKPLQILVGIGAKRSPLLEQREQQPKANQKQLNKLREVTSAKTSLTGKNVYAEAKLD